jgi:hypothetical protein
MPARPNVWVVVAGPGDVRIVAPCDEVPGLEVVAVFGAPNNNVDGTADQGQIFLRSVAAHVSREAARGAFDHLMLFAPSEPLSALREALGAVGQAKVRSALALDLSGVDIEQLLEHLAPHLALLD